MLKRGQTKGGVRNGQNLKERKTFDKMIRKGTSGMEERVNSEASKLTKILKLKSYHQLQRTVCYTTGAGGS